MYIFRVMRGEILFHNSANKYLRCMTTNLQILASALAHEIANFKEQCTHVGVSMLCNICTVHFL